jgi:hypothetical protein
MNWEDIGRRFSGKSKGTAENADIVPSLQAEEHRIRLDHGVEEKPD